MQIIYSTVGNVLRDWNPFLYHQSYTCICVSLEIYNQIKDHQQNPYYFIFEHIFQLSFIIKSTEHFIVPLINHRDLYMNKSSRNTQKSFNSILLHLGFANRMICTLKIYTHFLNNLLVVKITLSWEQLNKIVVLCWCSEIENIIHCYKKILYCKYSDITFSTV